MNSSGTLTDAAIRSLSPSRDFREQGNMAINFLGTWEQKQNKTGNTGTREQNVFLGNREHQNRRKTFSEHGNTRKILMGTREHVSPWDGLIPYAIYKRISTAFESNERYIRKL